MANNIVMAQRTAPWLGIGVSGQWEHSIDALEAAGLDFHVRQEQMFWMRDDDGIVYNEKAPMFANVRDTDDRLLGCVTPQYSIIQNRDAFSLIDPFLGNGGIITNVGMTEDGLCFMVARMMVETIGREPYEINLMLTNSFNTKYPCQIIMTPIRIYCQNMYRKLVNDRIFLAKHTTTANQRLIALANGNAVEKKVMAFASVVECAQGKRMSKGQYESLLALLFPYPKEGGPREATYKLKAEEQRTLFHEKYYLADDNKEHLETAFGFINAYFDWLSHRDPTKHMQMAWVDRRLSGLVSGNDIDSHVINQALR